MGKIKVSIFRPRFFLLLLFIPGGGTETTAAEATGATRTPGTTARPGTTKPGAASPKATNDMWRATTLETVSDPPENITTTPATTMTIPGITTISGTNSTTPETTTSPETISTTPGTTTVPVITTTFSGTNTTFPGTTNPTPGTNSTTSETTTPTPGTTTTTPVINTTSFGTTTTVPGTNPTTLGTTTTIPGAITTPGTTAIPGTTNIIPETTTTISVTNSTPGTTTTIPGTTTTISGATTHSGTTTTFPGTITSPGTSTTPETASTPGTITTISGTTTTIPVTNSTPGTNSTISGTTTPPETTNIISGATTITPGTTTATPETPTTTSGTTTTPGIITTISGTTTTVSETTTTTIPVTNSTPGISTTNPGTTNIISETTTTTSGTTTTTLMTTTSNPSTTTTTPTTTTTTTTPRTTRRTTIITTTTMATTMTTGPHSPTTPGICSNGGTWVNGHCQCPLGFTGDRCEDISNTIETNAETNGTVQVELRVTNRNFTKDLENSSSPAYQKFVQEFIKQMDPVYATIEGYQGIVVTGLRNGSVVVEHFFTVSLKMTSETQEKLQNIAAELKEKIKAAAVEFNCTSGDLCFNSSEVNITTTMGDFNVATYCQRLVQEDLQEYYFPNLTISGLSCMSNCTPDTASTINCNHGKCNVTHEGPKCFCNDPDVFWYQDDYCASRINKLARRLNAVVASVVPIMVILAIVVVFLSVCVHRARKNGFLDMVEREMRNGSYVGMFKTLFQDSVTSQNRDGPREHGRPVNREVSDASELMFSSSRLSEDSTTKV